MTELCVRTASNMDFNLAESTKPFPEKAAARTILRLNLQRAPKQILHATATRLSLHILIYVISCGAAGENLQAGPPFVRARWQKEAAALLKINTPAAL